MNKKITGVLVSMALLVCIALPIHAHHSASGLFDMGKSVSVEGVVTEVWFQNPHSRYYMSVEGDDGAASLWEVETMSPNWFIRRGWDEDTVVVGTRIRAQGPPARDGSNRLLLRILDREGVEVYRWVRPASPVISNLEE